MKKLKLGFGFWLCVISFGLAGLIIWGAIASQKSNEARNEAKTSREIALACTTDMATRFHIHPQLKITINGNDQTLPADIGIKSSCLNSINTHDATGMLHVESPVKKDFTFGDFFAVWDKEFNQNKILDYKTDDTHIITVSVNGKLVDTYENTVLNDKDQIVISYQIK